jgi:hypothetical protein
MENNNSFQTPEQQDVQLTVAEKKLIKLIRETQLTAAEESLVKLIREIRYGEVKVIINDGVPVRADEIRKSHKL